MNIYGFVTIMLLMALAINLSMAKTVDFFYFRYLICPLQLIILQALVGFSVITKIEENYKNTMVVGKEYVFFVSTVEKERVLGYVVINGSYIEAVIENISDSNIEEQEEIKVTLVQAELDMVDVIVKI